MKVDSTTIEKIINKHLTEALWEFSHKTLDEACDKFKAKASVELEKLIADLLTVLKTNFNYGEDKMTVSISFPSSRFSKDEK